MTVPHLRIIDMDKQITCDALEPRYWRIIKHRKSESRDSNIEMDTYSYGIDTVVKPFIDKRSLLRGLNSFHFLISRFIHAKEALAYIIKYYILMY